MQRTPAQCRITHLQVTTNVEVKKTIAYASILKTHLGRATVREMQKTPAQCRITHLQVTTNDEPRKDDTISIGVEKRAIKIRRESKTTTMIDDTEWIKDQVPMVQ
jgi:hypothetical protein